MYDGVLANTTRGLDTTSFLDAIEDENMQVA